ncbi:MAG: transposase [Rhizobiaceae bacterium]|nr:MAG: transposase [Rhizobiaceae bacterium]
MTEYGWIASKGLAHPGKLGALLADPSALPDGVRSVCLVLLDSLAMLDRQIALLDKEIERRSPEDAVARRLMTIPGIGPITARGITAPPSGTFTNGCDCHLGRPHTASALDGGQTEARLNLEDGERTLRRMSEKLANLPAISVEMAGRPGFRWPGSLLANECLHWKS